MASRVAGAASVLLLLSSLVLQLRGGWCEKPFTLTLLTQAAEKGAVCLDGSPPGYYYRAGTNKKWIVFLQGGGWCYDEQACVDRSKSSLGSSKSWPTSATFEGILSDSPTDNKQLYDWNMAHVNYCDGASFAGNRATPLVWKGTTIYFRGISILSATIDSLMEAGMKDAEEVILSGCSAGGLATYVHADFVHSRLPSTTVFHAIADAGYFINANNISGDSHIQDLYQYVYKMQNCSVDSSCLAVYTSEEWRCFFPQYAYSQISSPIFLLNSAYDSWQLGNILQLPGGCIPPSSSCSQANNNSFAEYREEFLQAAQNAVASPINGVFIDSCVTHCQTQDNRHWGSVSIQGQSAQETFANWYDGQPTNSTKRVDCKYGCNPTC